MKALIYTNSDKEYDLIRNTLSDVSQLIDVRRDPLDGHGHYTDPYDIVIVALDGARGMNEVTEWSGRFPLSRIIWITDDKEFASVALQRHITDFIVRPFDASSLKECFKRNLSDCSGANAWHIPSQV